MNPNIVRKVWIKTKEETYRERRKERGRGKGKTDESESEERKEVRNEKSHESTFPLGIYFSFKM